MERAYKAALICKAQYLGLGIVVCYYLVAVIGGALLIGAGGSPGIGVGFYSLATLAWAGFFGLPLVFLIGVAGLIGILVLRPEIEAAQKLSRIGIIASINVLCTISSLKSLPSAMDFIPLIFSKSAL